MKTPLTTDDLCFRFRKIGKARIWTMQGIGTGSVSISHEGMPKSVAFGELADNWEISNDRKNWEPATREGLVALLG